MTARQEIEAAIAATQAEIATARAAFERSTGKAESLPIAQKLHALGEELARGRRLLEKLGEEKERAR